MYHIKAVVDDDEMYSVISCDKLPPYGPELIAQVQAVNVPTEYVIAISDELEVYFCYTHGWELSGSLITH